MKVKKHLPQSAEELRTLPCERQAELWRRYSSCEYKNQVKALAYYIACESNSFKIDRKHLTKIAKYAETPEACMTKARHTKYNLKAGSEIIKTFRGIEFKVIVCDHNDFLYNGNYYKTLSAVAKEICGIKVSGPDFFEIGRAHV